MVVYKFISMIEGHKKKWVRTFKEQTEASKYIKEMYKHHTCNNMIYAGVKDLSTLTIDDLSNNSVSEIYEVYKLIKKGMNHYGI